MSLDVEAMTSNGETKEALRRRMRLARDEQPAEWRTGASKAICERVRGLPAFVRARRVALFAAFGSEVETRFLEDAALAGAKEVCYPKVLPEEELAFVAGSRASLIVGASGIPEPATAEPAVELGTIDLFVVPGLAFDVTRHRLGYGRGYYDRVLARVPGAVKVGVGFDFQRVDRLPAETFDIPLDAVVTEKRTI